MSRYIYKHITFKHDIMITCNIYIDLSSNHLTTNYQDEEEDVEDIDGYLTHEHLEMVKQESNNKLVLSTRNLICWSFQISQGMCHLANKKVYFAFRLKRNGIINNKTSISYRLFTQIWQPATFCLPKVTWPRSPISDYPAN